MNSLKEITTLIEQSFPQLRIQISGVQIGVKDMSLSYKVIHDLFGSNYFSITPKYHETAMN